tara:strand:+ start:8120 stop:8647 length:528 start_codon:yes stop_codon:yes gene_type:complete
MIRFFIFLIIFLAGCSNSNKVYICGDHPCKNKKEIEDYFKNNISMEVYVIQSDKEIKKNQDLVKLNLDKDNKKIDNKKKKLIFLDNKKVNIEEKRKKGKPKKINLQVRTDIENQAEKKVMINKSKIKKKKFEYKTTKSKKIVHMCKKVEECDIDIISKKISDLGNEESFPDVNFR